MEDRERDADQVGPAVGQELLADEDAEERADEAGEQRLELLERVEQAALLGRHGRVDRHVCGSGRFNTDGGTVVNTAQRCVSGSGIEGSSIRMNTHGVAKLTGCARDGRCRGPGRVAEKEDRKDRGLAEHRAAVASGRHRNAAVTGSLARSETAVIEGDLKCRRLRLRLRLPVIESRTR